MTGTKTDKLNYKHSDINFNFDNYNQSEITVDKTLFRILIRQYKNPIASIVREIVSNAIDATKEAGKDTPVIVSLSKEEFVVVDKGIGISPERAKNYFNFNQSTKRYDLNLIGQFGLGSKCVLAYTNTVTITTVYDGIKYTYLQFLNGDGIPGYKLLKQEETKEENGTKVSIPIKRYDFDEFKKELRFIKFNPNVYILINGSDTWFNENNKIYKYNNFFVTQEYFTSNWNNPFRNALISYKGILYPLDIYQLEDSKWYIGGTIPVIEDIVDLVPSRDALEYTERTKKVLNKVLKKAYEEITAIYKKQNTHYIKTFEDFYFFGMKSNHHVVIDTENDYKIYSDTFESKEIVYFKNKKIEKKEILNEIRSNKRFSNIKIKIIFPGKLYTRKDKFSKGYYYSLNAFYKNIHECIVDKDYIVIENSNNANSKVNEYLIEENYVKEYTSFLTYKYIDNTPLHIKNKELTEKDKKLLQEFRDYVLKLEKDFVDNYEYKITTKEILKTIREKDKNNNKTATIKLKNVKEVTIINRYGVVNTKVEMKKSIDILKDKTVILIDKENQSKIKLMLENFYYLNTKIVKYLYKNIDDIVFIANKKNLKDYYIKNKINLLDYDKFKKDIYEGVKTILPIIAIIKKLGYSRGKTIQRYREYVNIYTKNKENIKDIKTVADIGIYDYNVTYRIQRYLRSIVKDLYTDKEVLLLDDLIKEKNIADRVNNLKKYVETIDNFENKLEEDEYRKQLFKNFLKNN